MYSEERTQKAVLVNQHFILTYEKSQTRSIAPMCCLHNYEDAIFMEKISFLLELEKWLEVVQKEGYEEKKGKQKLRAYKCFKNILNSNSHYSTTAQSPMVYLN